MLTLVEPCVMGNLLDRPDLGCSMLIAACQEKGIKTTLIKGQTRFLKDMFVNDSEELWNLIKDLKESDLKKIRISEYKKAVQKKGIKQFQDELESLYQHVIIDKNPRNYFNGSIVEKFNNLHNIFASVYFYYLSKLNYRKLKIIDRYIAEIINSDTRYIGFSLQNSFEPLSRIIRKRIKELTEIPIIVGGSLTPFINLKTVDKTFMKEYFDYLVIGAGECALPSLIETLNNKKEPKGIANVFYKKNGKLRGNNLEVIRDLDNLPYPDYSQFDLDLYLTPKRVLPMQTARGCSWRKCAFCSHHNIDSGNYRTFSIKKIVETIKHLQNTYNCSHFAFHDEGLPPRWSKQISEAILRSDLKSIYINTYARPVDGYNNNNLLRLMRKAGFTLIHWGIESGSQRVLDIMNKGIKISTVSQILRKSSKNMIANLCFIIFGFPGETKKEAQQTVEFLKSCADNIEETLIQPFSINLNSPIGRNPEKWGVDIKENNSYLTKSGMSSEQSNIFFSKISAEFKINSIKLSSDKLNYLLPGHNRRMLRFLSSSHEFLPNVILLEYLIKGKLNNIFPIILGEIKKKNGKTIFYPINIRETIFINKNFPQKEKVLDSLEEKIFILSDGTLSTEEIILTIYRDFKHEYGVKNIRKKCTDFLRDMFIKNLALGFAKSW